MNNAVMRSTAPAERNCGAIASSAMMTATAIAAIRDVAVPRSMTGEDETALMMRSGKAGAAGRAGRGRM